MLSLALYHIGTVSYENIQYEIVSGILPNSSPRLYTFQQLWIQKFHFPPWFLIHQFQDSNIKIDWFEGATVSKSTLIFNAFRTLVTNSDLETLRIGQGQIKSCQDCSQYRKSEKAKMSLDQLSELSWKIDLYKWGAHQALGIASERHWWKSTNDTTKEQALKYSPEAPEGKLNNTITTDHTRFPLHSTT